MPGERTAAYYGERAAGGTGLIIAELTAVRPGSIWSPMGLGLWDDVFISGWRKVVDTIHSHNGKAAIQLGDQGRSLSSQVTGMQPVAPSAVPCRAIQEVPHEMSRDEVYRFIDDLSQQRKGLSGLDLMPSRSTYAWIPGRRPLCRAWPTNGPTNLGALSWAG